MPCGASQQAFFLVCKLLGDGQELRAQHFTKLNDDEWLLLEFTPGYKLENNRSDGLFLEDTLL